MTSLERLLGQSLGLRTRTRSQASIDAAKRERSYYSKAKRLADKMGVVIEVDRYMCPFGMTPTKWVYDGDDFEQKSGITQEEFERRWPDERGQVEWEVIYSLLHWTLVEGKPVSEYQGCSTM